MLKFRGKARLVDLIFPADSILFHIRGVIPDCVVLDIYSLISLSFEAMSKMFPGSEAISNGTKESVF